MCDDEIRQRRRDLIQEAADQLLAFAVIYRESCPHDDRSTAANMQNLAERMPNHQKPWMARAAAELLGRPPLPLTEREQLIEQFLEHAGHPTANGSGFASDVATRLIERGWRPPTSTPPADEPMETGHA